MRHPLSVSARRAASAVIVVVSSAQAQATAVADHLAWSQAPAAHRISIDITDTPLSGAVTVVAATAGIRLSYSPDDFTGDARVSYTGTNVTPDSAFRAVLAGTPLRVVMTSGATGVVIRERAPRTHAVQRVGTLIARVVDSTSDAPLADALVTIEGTTFRGITTAAGLAVIAGVPEGQYDISARVLGFRALRMTGVRVRPDSSVRVTFRLLESPAILDQMQVTATKTAQSLVDVPAMTTTVSQQAIAQQGDGRFTQALNNVPGLVNSALETQFESVMLRGMPREGDEWTNTLLMIDGVPQTTAENDARVINLPLQDVNSVEVVEGPNSALYGRTAVGGVVNVLTPNPTADPRFDAELQLGQQDQFGLKGAASGPIDDWGGYYLAASENQNHGYYTQPYIFNIKDNDLFGKFTFSPDRASHGMISINEVVSDNALPTPLPIINGKLLSQVDPQISVFQNYNLPSSNYHQEETRATLSYDRIFEPWFTGTGTVSYRHILYQFVNDGDGVGSPFTDSTFEQYPFGESYSENIYYSELRGAIRPRIGAIDNQLLVGASYDYTTGYGSGNVIYTDTTLFGWAVNFKNPQSPGIPPMSNWKYLPYGGNSYNVGILGAYAQYLIAPLPRLGLIFAGRYDDAYLSNTPSPGPGTTPRVSNRWSAFSPKASATVRLVGPDSSARDANLRLNTYVTYSTAFVPPRTPGALNPQDSLNLRPQYVQNYEGGFKGDAIQGRLSFDFGYFFMREDGIVIDTRVGPFFYPTNAGVENFQGFEGAVQWNPIPSVALYGNVAWYHDRYGRFVIQSAGVNEVLTGNRMPISPDNVDNIGGSWRLWRGFGLQGNVKHVGTTFLDQGDTYLLPAYTVTDASVFWEHRSVTLTLSAHNLFNARYYTMGDIELAQSVDPAAPRQLLLTTSVHLR